MLLIKKSCGYLFVAFLIAFFALSFNSTSSMSPVWYGPYLSGALNLELGGEFLVSVEELDQFRELDNEARHAFKFKRKDNLEQYQANPIGYVYLVWVSQKLFPWVSHIHALEYFQLAAHIAFSMLILVYLKERWSQVLFFFIYAVNPIVVYYVVYPYYYFWQVVPSLLFVLLFLTYRRKLSDSKKMLLISALSVLAPLAGVVLSTRPTTLAILLFSLIFLFFHESIRKILAASLILVTLAAFLFVNKPMSKNFYHTVYVGFGAYPNAYLTKPSDHEGYALFEQEYGYALDGSIGGNYYQQENIEKYRELTKNRSLEIALENPGMIVRNAALSYFQSFTIGYLTERPIWVYYLLSIAGFVFACVLLVSRQYLLFLAISAASSTFVLYYPPIPAYMYGSYLLLCVALVNIVHFILARGRRSTRHG